MKLISKLSAAMTFLFGLTSVEAHVANTHILPKGPLWPNKIVPYVLDPQFTAKERALIQKAMEHFEDDTCVKFRPRKGDAGYVRIYKRIPGDLTGESAICGSELGYAGPKVHILILGQRECFLHGRLLHEFMHLLGFPHEHSRTDRDKYIKINWQNMQNLGGDEALNYKKFPGRYVKAGPYDYYSIMHYSLYSNSRNGWSKTLIPTSPDVDESKIGQRIDFTETDLKKVNHFYACSKGKGKFYNDLAGGKTLADDTSAPVADDGNAADDLDPGFWKSFDVKSLW